MDAEKHQTFVVKTVWLFNKQQIFIHRHDVGVLRRKDHEFNSTRQHGITHGGSCKSSDDGILSGVFLNCKRVRVDHRRSNVTHNGNIDDSVIGKTSFILHSDMNNASNVLIERYSKLRNL